MVRHAAFSGRLGSQVPYLFSSCVSGRFLQNFTLSFLRRRYQYSIKYCHAGSYIPDLPSAPLKAASKSIGSEKVKCMPLVTGSFFLAWIHILEKVGCLFLI